MLHLRTMKTAARDALPAPSSLRRWLPLGLLAAVSLAGYALGLQNYFTLQSISEHQSQLQAYVSQNLFTAVAVFFAIYVVVVALSLPGAALLSILGGFVFGWVLSAPLTVVAATIGATAVFKIVQTSLGSFISERAGSFVKKLSVGFEKDALNYLLFLRLVPVFPFFAVNAVAGLTRMPMRTFIWVTVVGIIPGSYVFAWLGRGLGSVLDAQSASHAACVAEKGASACPYGITLSALVTPQILWALAALGVIALVPVLMKKWKATT